MNEMNTTALSVASNTASTAGAATKASQDSREALLVLEQTVNSISSLYKNIGEGTKMVAEVDDNVTEISSMLSVIGGIAAQTNLLALNAAIEAARAGEQGRGFAVVADEVRTLAGKTQNCTEDIKAMIDKLQAGTKHAVASMSKSSEQGSHTMNFVEQVKTSLSHIAGSIETISSMNIQVATTAEEQTAISTEILANLNQISSATSLTLSAVTDSVEMSESLNLLEVELRNRVNRFKL